MAETEVTEHGRDLGDMQVAGSREKPFGQPRNVYVARAPDPCPLPPIRDSMSNSCRTCPAFIRVVGKSVRLGGVYVLNEIEWGGRTVALSQSKSAVFELNVVDIIVIVIGSLDGQLSKKPARPRVNHFSDICVQAEEVEDESVKLVREVQAFRGKASQARLDFILPLYGFLQSLGI